ncbi:hypothetical protein CR513_33977, partial [Mucuna pruriens]
MRQTLSHNLFSSFKLGAGRMDISLLQFSYDTLFFRELSMRNVVTMKSMLRCFKLVSRLKVGKGTNKRKSVIWRYVALFNCRSMTISIVYFGNFSGGESEEGINLETNYAKVRRKIVPLKT